MIFTGSIQWPFKTQNGPLKTSQNVFKGNIHLKSCYIFLDSVNLKMFCSWASKHREECVEVIELNGMCKAPEGELRLSFRRLANYMPFSSLTATLSARWDFNNFKRGKMK